MEEKNPYIFLSIKGQVNTLAVVPILAENIQENIIVLDKYPTRSMSFYENNYVYIEWYGYPENIDKAQPLLSFLKNRLQSYMYPVEFTITIKLKETGG